MDGPVRSFIRDLFAVKFDEEAHDSGGERINGDGKCYPNCDCSVWLRSCEKEIIEPIDGEIKGTIPLWLNGCLLRNGPGSLKVGDMQFQHLFDSSALLHRFEIKNGQVTYQCRFIQTETYKKNLAAQRIVLTEFGTNSVPDPCQSIFQKIASVFKANTDSDNTMISIYPYGDEFYTFTENPIMHRINIKNLQTEGRINVSDYAGIVSHTSHPHVMNDGTVYNLGLSVTKTGPVYCIICFPNGEHMFEDAHIVASVPCRWKLHPGYMHTFGITENYFIIVEQPLSISITERLKTKLLNQPMFSSFKWFEDKCTYIYLVERSTGKLKQTYKAEAFFYLHIINQYEINSHIILDICCYKNPSMLNCMYIESMMNMQINPNYANMFRGRPLRFVLPLPNEEPNKNRLVKSLTFSNLFSRFQTNFNLKRSESETQDISYYSFDDSKTNGKTNENDVMNIICNNLITLENTKAQAFKMPDDSIFVKPELLCDLGCETPRINYEKNLGVRYRYFYAISSDVDADNPGTLIKVDTINKTKMTWCEPNCYPSEPVFVSNPNPTSEDDGIILSAAVWGNLDENRVTFLILCAKNWIELGRCEFRTSGPVPKCLHGWFAPNKNFNHTKTINTN